MFKVWDLKIWIFQIFQSQEGLYSEVRGWIKITCLISKHQQAKRTIKITQDVFFFKIIFWFNRNWRIYLQSHIGKHFREFTGIKFTYKAFFREYKQSHS